jgi:hypothetical protein
MFGVADVPARSVSNEGMSATRSIVNGPSAGFHLEAGRWLVGIAHL